MRTVGRAVFVLGVVCLLAVEGALVAGDWPQWRGPDRTGLSAEKGLLKEWPEGGPPLVYKAPGIGRGRGSVAVVDGKIYVVGDRRGKQYLSCLKAEDGKEIWSTIVREPGDGSRSTPTVDGDRVYVVTSRGAQEGGIVCLDTATGKEVWAKDFKQDFNGRMMTSWGYSESPLVDGDKVIVTPGGSESTLVALDKKTGEVIWKAAVPQGDAAGYSSVVVTEVGGVRQYVQLLERGIVGIAAKDGRFLWRYNRVANGTANIPTPIVKGDLVFCSSGYNTGAALLRIVPAGTGRFRVEEKYFLPANIFQNHHGGMVLVGDYVYAGTGHNNGFPICIELKTGRVAWRKDRGPGTGSAAIVYADGNIYYRYDNALMALIQATPRSCNLRGTFRIPNGDTPSWPHPVVADGKLFLRDQDKLYCYNVKAE